MICAPCIINDINTYGSRMYVPCMHGVGRLKLAKAYSLSDRSMSSASPAAGAAACTRYA